MTEDQNQQAMFNEAVLGRLHQIAPDAVARAQAEVNLDIQTARNAQLLQQIEELTTEE